MTNGMVSLEMLNREEGRARTDQEKLSAGVGPVSFENYHAFRRQLARALENFSLKRELNRVRLQLRSRI